MNIQSSREDSMRPLELLRFILCKSRHLHTHAVVSTGEFVHCMLSLQDSASTDSARKCLSNILVIKMLTATIQVHDSNVNV